jgi:Phage integrase, N-terminal SAM-like domain
MSHPQPVAPGHQLPRGHLLVLSRSFRRTLEAENKSPRTIEAYTDAVRLLAIYCQAHTRPLLAGKLQREHIQEFIADQLTRWSRRPPTTATARLDRPLSWLAGALEVGRWRSRRGRGP